MNNTTSSVEINSQKVLDCIKKTDERIRECVLELLELGKRAEHPDFIIRESERSKYFFVYTKVEELEEYLSGLTFWKVNLRNMQLLSELESENAYNQIWKVLERLDFASLGKSRLLI